MKVYEDYSKCIKVYGSIWRYIKYILIYQKHLPSLARSLVFVFHADPHIPNIGYMKVYDGLQALGGILSFFSLNLTSNAVRIMSGDPLRPEL